MAIEEGAAGEPQRGWGRLILIGVALTAANLAVYLLLPPALLESLGGFGYLGAFASAALANATVIVPVPYYPLLIRLGQAFNPYGVALAAAAGSVIGELVAFYVGRAGRGSIQRTRFYEWARRQLSHPWRAPLVLFALSAPPNPSFDVAGLLAGAVGVPVWVFVIAVFLGRIIRMGVVVALGLGLQ
jgi:membrane protein YqaA with SNARE-associated domain